MKYLQNLSRKFIVKENLILIVILLIAAFFRLYRIGDYMTFLGDEGRDVLVVYNILHGHLTLLGPTSSVGGFFLGPIYYYFMAPFLLLFNYNPVGPAVMVALFGVLTVYLVYKITSEFFGKSAGFIASALYAISPLVVAYSRSSWNPNLMPIFTLICLYTLYKAVLRKKLWLFLLVGILYGILMQLHYIEFFIGIVIFIYVLFISFIFHENKNITQRVLALAKKYFVILIGFLIGFFPYIAFEARHGFTNTSNIIKFIFHSPEVSGGGNTLGIIGDVFFRLFARLLTAFPPPEQLHLYSKDLLWFWDFGVIFIAVGSTGYFVYQYAKVWRKKEEKFLQYSLILFWFFIGVFLFGLYKKSIYDYYFEFIFPIPFMLLGSFLYSIYSSSKQKYLGKFITLTILVILITVNLLGTPFRYQPNRQLNQMRSIADFVLKKTNDSPFNFAIITGGNSDHAYRYFFTVWGHPPVTIEYPGKDPKRTSVTNQLFVVCESLPCQPVGHSLWEIAGFGRAEIADSWDVSVVKIYKLTHYKGK